MDNAPLLLQAGVAALLRNKTAAGTRISTNRAKPFVQQDEQDGSTIFPALIVYIRRIDWSRFREAPRSYEGEVVIGVECCLTDDGGATAIDADVLALAHEVRCALLANLELKPSGLEDGLASDGDLEEEEYEQSAEAERMIGSARISMNYKIHVDAAEPDASRIGTFERADVDWHLAPSDGELDAEDAILPDQD